MIRGELALLSGTAHPALAEAVADELDVSLLDANIGRFPDGESRIQILSDVRDRDVFLIQPTGYPVNEHVMEGVLTVDALRRASADRITAVIPYFGYGRQDRKDASRVPISAAVVTCLFDSVGVDRFLSFDPHAPQIQGFTATPFDNLTLAGVLADVLKEETNEPIVVAPDLGAIKRARNFAYLLDTTWAAFDKHRTSPTSTEIKAKVGADVAGRDVVLVDDVISTGSSILRAVEQLDEQGAQTIDVAVSHGVFAGDALEQMVATEKINRIFVTDTLPPRGESSKIRCVTIAPLLAKAIRHIHEGRSVTELFPKLP